MPAIHKPGETLYGIQLPVQTLTKTLRSDWEPQATVEDLTTIAQHCEKAGLDFIGVCDHIAIPNDDYAKNMSTTWFDPVATLSYLAAHTSTIRLLSVVWIAAYRHPLMTAKSFATLDKLSGGRVILGVGAGHVAGEFAALGVDFASRGKILDDCIKGVRSALGSGDYSSYSGDFYSWEDCGVGPKPAQESLPIWVGGTSLPAFRRVGRLGDGWIPMGTPKEQIPQICEIINEAADKAGRDKATFDIGHMPGVLYLGDLPEELAGKANLTGSAAEIAAELDSACALGANVQHIRFASRDLSEYMDQISSFGEEVLPLLAKN